jgi:hypothetical protein
MTTKKNTVYVLRRLKPSGDGDRQISSSPDQSVRALRLKADELTETGQGGGIVTLLLPKDETQARRLVKDKTMYSPDEVKPRKGEVKTRPKFAATREPFERDYVHKYLYDQFILTLEPDSSLRQRSVKAQCRWLQGEISKKEGEVYRYLSQQAADILESNRSFRWLQDRLSRNEKCRAKGKTQS